MSNQGSEFAEQAEAEKNASWKGTKESRANSTVPTPTVNQSLECHSGKIYYVPTKHASV